MRPLPVPAADDLPASYGFRLGETTHLCDDGATVMAGASVLRLQPAAASVVAGAPTTCATPTARVVARRLLDRDAAVPWWPGPAPADEAVRDVTVVVPIRDRERQLARLLDALPTGLPVVVVDDASADPRGTRLVAESYGARWIGLDHNVGPAAARDRGLREVATPHVAFVDSDVVPGPGWLGTLRRHLDDPALAVVAPRVLGVEAAEGDGWLDRYEQARSSLDLGAAPAAVRVGGRVAYLPSACLLARVSALGDGFDTDLRCGEDVDLVWRLLGAGWRVRYEPAAVVRHDHRTTLWPWLGRKAFYGTSAAPLAARHGDAVAPLVLSPWTAALAVALLAQRRWSLPVAAGVGAVTTAAVARRLGGGRASWRSAGVMTLEAGVAAVWQTGSALTRHYWPLAALAATRSRRVRRAVAVAAVVDGLADRRRVGSTQPAAAYVAARRLDDLAYGAGLWWGAARERSVRALLPALRGIPRRRH